MKFLSKEKISNHRYKTPEGYLVCLDAIIARTGKQDYFKNEVFKDSDDESIISIDRPANEVFSPETITSFENKPFVDEHPDEDVNVDNHREYAIGFVRDVRRATVDGEDVLIANLVVTDAEAIAEIESGEKVELSCGYDCDILGEEPNLYQANIRGNHVALCKAGRAGIARIQDTRIKDSKWFIVYGEESGYMKEFKTLPEAKRFIKETQKFDKREGIEDKYYIEVEVHDSVEDSVKDSKYSKLLKDLSPEERLSKIDELIADEEEAIVGYKEAMKYANEADKSIYAHIIAEELEHITELKTLRAENFEKNSKIVSESTDDYFDIIKKGEIRKFNSVNELNKWLNSKVEDSIMKDEEMINDVDERLIKILEKIANDYNKAKISQSNARTSKSDLRYINTKHELASDLRNNLKNQWNKVVNTFNNTYQLVLGNEPSLYRVEEFKRLLKGEKHKNDSKEEEMIKDKLNNKPITIEIVFDSTEEAKNALKILQRKEQFINSKLINNNSIEVKTTDLYYDELKKILKLYFVEKISIIDSIEDELIEPEQKYINEFEKELNYMQFKIVKISKTFTGRTHYQVITKTSGYYDKDLNTFKYGLDKLSKKMKSYGILVTYNIGLQKDGYISVGIDLDKQYVRDSINNEEKLLKDSIKARTLIKIYRFVKDSDKLKQLAYQFAQMGNYFDRANSANSRNILAREDDTKIAEFYNLGLQVYEQLKQEVNYLKNNTNASKRILYNETFDLLYDGSTRLHWIRDPKCKLLAKKLDELINAYKQYAVKR